MGAVRVGQILAVVVVATCAGCGSDRSDPPSAVAPEQLHAVEVTVARITDGDTLRLRDGRRVRLVQIDAPEDGGECYGRAAASALAQLVRPGTRVLVARDPALDGRDGYGRLLRYVFVERTLVNLELVRRGAAMPYFFHRERGLFAADLMDSAEDARDARRGLWAACPRAKLDPNRRSLTGPG